MPNTGQPIGIYFSFIDGGGHNGSKIKFDSRGVCRKALLRKKVFIRNIEILIRFVIPNGMENDKSIHKLLLDELQTTLVHELAHAKDDIRNKEWVENPEEKRDGARTTDAELKYLHYWLDPSEIRSHMNEMIKRMSGNRHITPQRNIRNRYKQDDEKEGGITNVEKDNLRSVYSKDKQSNTKSISEKSLENLREVLNNAFRNDCPEILKEFIVDYHIAFVKDSNPTMKKRYYDVFFPDVVVPSLQTLEDFYEGIKSAYRQLTKLKNEVEKSFRKMTWNNQSESGKQMVDGFNSLRNDFWNKPEFAKPFEKYDVKLLKKAIKIVIEKYRDEWGFETKAMMNKKAKEMMKSYK